MMIVTMRPGATVAEIGAVIRTCQSRDLIAVPSHGEHRTIIGVVTADRKTDLADVAALAGVDQVSPVSAAFKLVGREFRDEPTVVEVGPVQIGGPEFVVMAGPCSVEDPEQIEACAREVARCGGRILRGGAYKPRTSPYSFQGLGEKGLEILRAVREETGLLIVTEAIDHENIALVEQVADIVQIGARNMQNFSLLKRAGKSPRPILLKRGMSATVEELLMAAEYVSSQGNSRIILCERGVRTFADHSRNTLDLSAIPAVKAVSHLPIIVDPSHAAGRRDQVIPLARASVAVGADGIMVEVHCDPTSALSDGPQQLYPDQFEELMREVASLTELLSKAP